MTTPRPPEGRPSPVLPERPREEPGDPKAPPSRPGDPAPSPHEEPSPSPPPREDPPGHEPPREDPPSPEPPRQDPPAPTPVGDPPAPIQDPPAPDTDPGPIAVVDASVDGRPAAIGFPDDPAFRDAVERETIALWRARPSRLVLRRAVDCPPRAPHRTRGSMSC